jgi:iron complex outermembrane recepter protein
MAVNHEISVLFARGHLMKSSRTPLPAASAAMLAIGLAAPVHAQAAEENQPVQVAQATTEAAATNLDQVVVTGTRRAKGLQVSESPAPIQILTADTLKSAGQPDLIAALAQLVPSFTAQAFGGDQANQTLSAKLRGLSPNHALVLINGKRRHTTSNLAVLGGPYQGGASTDLNFIPLSSVERIEVLTDGAAAQYGTDAIAGVINIILKNSNEGGLVDGSYGGYGDGGGATTDYSGNIGFGAGSNGFLNLTGEVHNHQRSDRGGIDPRVVDPGNLSTFPNSNLPLVPGYPFVNHIAGDPEYHLYVGSYNAGYKLGGVELYSFGSYGRKKANSFENYRLPSRASYTSTTTDSGGNTTTTTQYFYPFGFNPREATEEEDVAGTFGAKGSILGWGWDLSSTYGKDRIQAFTRDSINTDLYADTGTSPTDFYDGAYAATQWTNNIDFSRDFAIGLATPLNVALGLEQRHETYELEIGEAASRYKSGASSFPGINPGDAGKHGRDNFAAYVDLSASPIKNLLVDVAGRFEHFTDFGNTTVGKLTTRYDIIPELAVRGTVSTGFRAPTLAEEFYSATNVGPTTAFVQLPPNAAAAALLGLGNGLRPEKSTNFSVGIVAHPIKRLTITLDAYQIQIRDRIVGSGALYSVFQGVPVPGAQAITDAIIANGNVLDPTVTTTGINIFANGLTTRTRGIDLVLSYPTKLIWGNIDWSASANYNETKVTKINASPAELGGQALFDRVAISDLETASPKYRLNFAAAYTLHKFSATLRETIYGKSAEQELGDDGVYYNNKISVTPITDLELSYKPIRSVKFSIGANNIFNIYPDQKNAGLLQSYRDANDNAAVPIYPTFSPFGFNGGFYYVKLGYTF